MSIEIVEELTNVVERLELLEEKFNVEISGLYAALELVGVNSYYLSVNFDITSRTGGAIDNNVRFRINLYNSDGQLMRTDDRMIYSHEFVGLDTINFSLDLPSKEQKPYKIRIFPVAG